MSTKEILVQLRALLDKPEHWTQSQMARNVNSAPVDPTSEEATQWCMAGGLCKITSNKTGTSMYYILARDAISAVVSTRVVNFNDSHTHADVLAAIEEAIKRCD